MILLREEKQIFVHSHQFNFPFYISLFLSYYSIQEDQKSKLIHLLLDTP